MLFKNARHVSSWPPKIKAKAKDAAAGTTDQDFGRNASSRSAQTTQMLQKRLASVFAGARISFTRDRNPGTWHSCAQSEIIPPSDLACPRDLSQLRSRLVPSPGVRGQRHKAHATARRERRRGQARQGAPRRDGVSVCHGTRRRGHDRGPSIPPKKNATLALGRIGIAPSSWFADRHCRGLPGHALSPSAQVHSGQPPGPCHQMPYEQLALARARHRRFRALKHGGLTNTSPSV